MALYTELLEESVKHDDFNPVDFIHRLQARDNAALFLFVEDILSENNEAIEPAFPAGGPHHTDDLAFEALRALPYATYQGIRPFLEQVFFKAIENGYKEKSEKVLDNVLALTVRRRQGLEVLFIIQQLRNADLAEKWKIRLAILLSKLENSVDISFWDKEIDLQRQPYLIPAYISAYKQADPAKGLRKLASVYQRPEWYHYCSTAVLTSLENLLIRNRQYQDFAALNETIADWARVEFKKILEARPFADHQFPVMIDGMKAAKTKITIGISLFPDLLLLLYAYKLEALSRDRLYSFDIRIVDWNNIFNALSNNELDLIIGNREVCREENSLGDVCEFVQPLIEYRGFSVVFHRDYPISTFGDVKRALENREDAYILKQTLLQLRPTPERPRKVRIFASKDTDHYNSLVALLNLAGIAPEDVDIVSDRDPQAGYELFARKDVDGLVGGLPQKLQALRNFGRELISKTDYPLPFTQVNGLICRTGHFDRLRDPIRKITREWHQISMRIARDPGHLKELLRLYNALVEENNMPSQRMDEDMFIRYWERTYFIPGNQQQVAMMIDEGQVKQQQEKLKVAIQTAKD